MPSVIRPSSRLMCRRIWADIAKRPCWQGRDGAGK
jgi:hypothetical protein